MTEPIVIHENRGPVSWVVLNRPERLNAFNTAQGRAASVPPRIAGAIKRMMYASHGSDLLMHLGVERAALLDMAATPEFERLVRAFQAGLTDQAD